MLSSLRRRDFLRVVGSMAGAGAATSLGGPSFAADPLKIGFIYLGPVGDHGWTYQHDQARLEVVKHFGDVIKTTFVENVAEGPDSEKVMADLANNGHKLIFATSFGYMNYTLNVAKRFPNVLFEHATGYKRAANVATYNIRFYESRYVQGVIAGKLSKSGLAGYVGSMPVPEVVQGLNAFMLGMQSVNPAARLKFVLINSWYDPPKEGDAAKALMDQGCDILTQHTDSPAPLQAAAGRGIKAFGQSSDMLNFAPTTQLTASTDSWGPYYQQRVQAVLDGTWKSTDTWGGFNSGLLTMSPFTNMPQDVAGLAQQTEADIKTGKKQVWAGPIVDQAGAQKIAPGIVPDDGTLNAMQWLVKGIEGKLT